MRIQRLASSHGLPLPSYQSEGAAGLDLLAALPAGNQLVLEPRARDLVPTGLVIELPAGYEGQVRPRSGLALKHGVTVLNAPGTIDSDYRGEVKVLLVNLGTEPFVIERGMRIAQLVIAPVTRVELQEEDIARRFGTRHRRLRFNRARNSHSGAVARGKPRGRDLAGLHESDPVLAAIASSSRPAHSRSVAANAGRAWARIARGTCCRRRPAGSSRNRRCCFAPTRARLRAKTTHIDRQCETCLTP